MLTTADQIAANEAATPDFVLPSGGVLDALFADCDELDRAIAAAQRRWNKYRDQSNPDYSCVVDCTTDPDCLEQFGARGLCVGVLYCNVGLIVRLRCVETVVVGGRVLKTFAAEVEN